MLAVITGATSGIGKAIAETLSRRGWELILTGRNETVLQEMRRSLPTKVDIIPLDLSEAEAPDTLFRFCQKRPVELLVNNAGFGVFGKFSETSLDDELEMIAVNIRALHILTKRFLRLFQRCGVGKILNVASSAGFLTGPLLSSYYASKNYVVRLSLAIAEELRREKSPVTISILCPGPVDTHFNDRARVQFHVKALTAEEVAEKAITGTFKGKLLIIPGATMKAGIFAARFAPQKLLSRIMYNVQSAKKS